MEGVAGAGKSTVAYKLAEALGWPVFRGFRDPASRERLLNHELPTGVEINSWVEDIYAMDVLRQVDCDVILDRTLISALAYDERLSEARKHELMDWWCRWFNQTGGLLLAVNVALATAAGRNKHEHSATFIEREARGLSRWLSEAAGRGVRVCSVENASDPEVAVERCLELTREALWAPGG